MGYIMEDKDESERLEKQSQLSIYSVDDEFRGIQFGKNPRILDAGCGTGLVARYLADRFPDGAIEGCDFSSGRLNDARALCKTPVHQKIKFFEGSLEQIPSENETYDAVTCRYVFEHLANPPVVVKEFARVLKPKGLACVVDFDGLIFNLYPQPPELAAMIDRLKHLLPIDLYVGRKIPALFQKAGFSQVRWKIRAIAIQGTELAQEKEIMEERFHLAMPQLKQILGSEQETLNFTQLYCKAMMEPGAVLFYNKFIVSALKAAA